MIAVVVGLEATRPHIIVSKLESDIKVFLTSIRQLSTLINYTTYSTIS